MSPNFLSLTKRSIKNWKFDGMCATSSANSIYFIRLCLSFVLTFKWDGLNNFPSVRVCRCIPYSAMPKPCLRSSKNKMPKSVEKNQPWNHCELQKVRKHSHRTVHVVIEKCNETNKWIENNSDRVFSELKTEFLTTYHCRISTSKCTKWIWL